MKSLATISLLVVSLSIAQANLIQNGGFEVNTNAGANNGIDDTADGWSKFTDLSANSSPDVWDNNGVNGILPGLSGYFTGFTAFAGTKFASIAGNPSQNNYIEGIESSSFTLAANTTYILSAVYAYSGSAPNGYNNPAPVTARLRMVSFPSVVLTQLPANTLASTWQSSSYQFQVTNSGMYSLILSAEGAVNNYLGVDEVALNPVPEPATLSVLALGGLAVLRRMKRKN